MIASSERVRRHDSPAVAHRIRRRTEMSIAYYREHPEEVGRRLRELEAEWDLERALGTASASFTLLGSVLTLAKGRRWLLLPLVVQGFYLQHQLEGWCPPLPVLRRLGFRTREEIERERHALEDIRGQATGSVEVVGALNI